ncbi:MAG: metallophosphoesterase family protein [Ancalomicrobiaceae bacterium]|nr:metallophosphoesterase family protein [Ancalomicrobiaceae bacterium]
MINLTTFSSPEAAGAGVIYVVGDIHGRLDLLRSIEDLIAADIESGTGKSPLICYLGDYVDRGPQSAEVIEWLSSRRPGRVKRVFLKGNHEDRMLAFLADPAAHGPAWLQYGGRDAFESYQIDLPAAPNTRDWDDARTELARRLPGSHADFLSNLRVAFRWRAYLMVHAGLDPDFSLEQQPQRALMWIRDPFLKSERDWGMRVVHGHVMVEEPVFRPNRINIDTGAWRTGRLTCLVLGDGVPRILQTGPQPASQRVDAIGGAGS